MTTTIAEPSGPKGLRAGYHWAYDGCPGTGTEDLMRAPYSPARGLSHWPDRMSAEGRRTVAVKCGIGTTMAKTLAAKCAQEDYALSVELGHRAYVELTGTRVRRSPVAPKATPKALVREDVRRRADGGRPVVLTDHELMKALGIKPIGYLD